MKFLVLFLISFKVLSNVFDQEASLLTKVSPIQNLYLVPEDKELELKDSRHCFPLLDKRIRSLSKNPQSTLSRSQAEIFQVMVMCFPGPIKDKFPFEAHRITQLESVNPGLTFLLINAQMYFSPSDFKALVLSLNDSGRKVFQDTKFFDDLPTDTQVTVLEAEEHFIVMSSGTSTNQDWLGNLSFVKKVQKEGNYHSGFLNAFQSIEKEVSEYLHTKPKKKVILVGHSLGGALSQIFLAKSLLTENFLDPKRIESVLTWAAPRVFANELALKLEKKIEDQEISFIRISNPKDLVPHLPPQALGFLAVSEAYERVSKDHWKKEKEKDKKSYYHFAREISQVNWNHMGPLYFSYHRYELEEMFDL